MAPENLMMESGSAQDLPIWRASISVVSQTDNTMGGATGVGYLYGSRSFSNFVGSNDSQDYYRIQVEENSQFNLTISGLEADADVELLNYTGDAIATGTLWLSE
ncbi:hypothetical protein [Leptothermofonsia sp. ETS-13]|uniref:hypothetical protein n=1 Tax=Leptothermofonsia sp. ETS-13 TaxID=3035696 RepID=UPI003B9E8C6C